MSDSKELSIQLDDTQLSNELSIKDLVNHVNKIQEIMGAVMTEGEHYDKLPGYTKPFLTKSGAEKLGFTFRLIPEFEITRNDLGDGHREYEIICTLRNMQSGIIVGQGVGNCSTMESKFRYRNDYIDTGRPVPKTYWKDRDPVILGGKNFVTKKNEEGKWTIMEKSGKIENPDIADVYNTVLKIAKKRSHVDTIITACAASDLFGQDLDEKIDKDKLKPKKTEPQKKISESTKKYVESAKKTELKSKLNVIMQSGYFTDEETKKAQELYKENVKTIEALTSFHDQYETELEKRKDSFTEVNNGASQAFDASD